MRKIVYSCLLICFTINLYACLNMYRVDQHGHEFYIEDELDEFPIFYQSHNAAYYQQYLDSNDFKYEKEHQFYSDKAVAMIMLGKVENGKNLLTKLLRENPNEYNIVVNLGTAYELLNQLDSAYYFLTKAYELNQNSHHGSEWLHLKVLEAKFEIQKNPNWLLNNKVLNIQLPNIENDTIHYNDTLNKIIKDIAYQLVERIPFTPNSDAILANIFNEYGDLLADYSIQMAYIAYEIGQRYDSDDNYKMNRKAAKMEQLISKRKDLRLPNIEEYYPNRNEFDEDPEHLTYGSRIHTGSNDNIGRSITNLIISLAVIVATVFIGIVLMLQRKRRRRLRKEEKDI